MKKESRVLLTEEQHEALSIAAGRQGMPLATYLRWCAIQHALNQGIHTEQPRADG